MLKHIYRWLQDKNFFKIFALFATLIVVFLSLKPPSQNPQSWTFLYLRGDLFLHFTCYFVMTFLYLFAFYTQNNSLSKSALISLALGFVLELLQLITFFQRFFDPFDLLANSLGVHGAWLIIKGIFYYSLKE
tara:strand:- start:231 stop:626 length:396 start_codon:yes stop_codon:yes gene_type:complete